MTQDEIIEMAKQSELGFLLGDNWMLHHELEYFAKLVAQHEREACLPPTPISENALYTTPAQQELVCVCGAVWEGQELVETPPQRTWVGLTDEDEIDWEEGGNLKDLVKAIEAKLKEKNT